MNIVSTGSATTENLEECRNLRDLLLSSLELDALPTHIWTALLRVTFQDVADDARRQAISQLPGASPKNNRAFQVVAASVVLQLKSVGYAEDFRSLLSERFGYDEWEYKKKQPDNKGERNCLLLEASVWLGAGSSRATRRAIESGILADTLAVALQKHLEDPYVRHQLKVHLAELAPSHASKEQPKDRIVATVPHLEGLIDLTAQSPVHEFAKRVRRQLQTDQRANNVEDPLPIKLTWSSARCQMTPKPCSTSDVSTTSTCYAGLLQRSLHKPRGTRFHETNHKYYNQGGIWNKKPLQPTKT